MKTLRRTIFLLYKGALWSELDDFQSHLTRQWNSDPEKKEFPSRFNQNTVFRNFLNETKNDHPLIPPPTPVDIKVLSASFYFSFFFFKSVGSVFILILIFPTSSSYIHFRQTLFYV